MSKKPILVTGAHRSGTTWVGKMLAASGEAAFISEPLNILHRPGVLSAHTRYWYTYICPENEAAYLPGLRQTLAYRYHLWAEVRSLRSRKDFLRMGRDWATFVRGRLRGRRPLLKDPFAVFSAPWFAARLEAQVVVTVRHPAAFASSLVRLAWPFDFADLLAQPLLMRDHLEPYRAQMEDMQRQPEDVIGQASLLWKMVYATVAGFRTSIPGLVVVRHEDLSLDPLEGYRGLYGQLGLTFTPAVANTVLNASSSENPKELSPKKVHAVRLDSRANLHNWKRRLAPQEISRIRRLTGDIAEVYYPEIEWD